MQNEKKRRPMKRKDLLGLIFILKGQPWEHVARLVPPELAARHGCSPAPSSQPRAARPWAPLEPGPSSGTVANPRLIPVPREMPETRRWGWPALLPKGVGWALPARPCPAVPWGLHAPGSLRDPGVEQQSRRAAYCRWQNASDRCNGVFVSHLLVKPCRLRWGVQVCAATAFLWKPLGSSAGPNSPAVPVKDTRPLVFRDHESSSLTV